MSAIASAAYNVPRALLLLLCATGASAATPAYAETPGLSPLTVADGIESTRAMIDGDKDAVFLSPDGRRYAMLLVTGDLGANGIWAELMVGDIAPGLASKPKLLARLFTNGLGPENGFALYGATALTMPQANIPKWLDNSRIALRWENAAGVIQVLSVAADTGDQQFITTSSTDVLGFAVSPDGTIVYDAVLIPSKEPSDVLLREGFAVTATDALPMIAGYMNGISMFDFMNCDRFVQAKGESKARKLELASAFHCGSGSFLSLESSSERMLFAPNGRYAILNAQVDSVPSDWSAYTNPSLKSWIKQHAENPKALAARLVQQLIVVDLHTGRSHQLWNAPHNTSQEIRIRWSPNGRSIVVWPTFAPPEHADLQGLNGEAVYEVEVETGRFRPIPIARSVGVAIDRVRYIDPSTIDIQFVNASKLRAVRTGQRWRATAVNAQTEKDSAPEQPRAQAAQIELRQDMNSSPKLYSLDHRNGTRRLILDLNPSFETKEFGRVQSISWTDADGRTWKGRLYYPIRYRAGEKYPIVLQARCVASEDEFSLYGCGAQSPTLGPGWSVFLGQALAGRGIAVLQLSAPEGGISHLSGKPPSSDEALIQEVLEKGWRAAAEHLISLGIADPHAVGVMGYSLTGWVAEYVLAHSEFKYAAAIASDHGNMGYLKAALDGWPVGPSNAASAAPFGSGLAQWLRQTPAFNADRISTPLQLQLTSSGEGFGNILWQWELYSRLRYLKKPVEYYVVPDVRRGSHTLQNPKQLLALQTRALDWWMFWLKGEETDGPQKEAQYRSWRELRRLHRQDVAAQRLSHPQQAGSPE